MTWGELCEKANRIEGAIVFDKVIWLNGIMYEDNGSVCVDPTKSIRGSSGFEYELATNRTPDQMYAIMEALR